MSYHRWHCSNLFSGQACKRANSILKANQVEISIEFCMFLKLYVGMLHLDVASFPGHAEW